MSQLAQVVAILRALEDRLDDPEGQLRQALHDILRIYGLVAQLAEVVTEQREQVQALAEAVTMLLGRQIEHNRAAIAQGVAIHSMSLLLDALASTQDPDIAQQAADARALLHTAALEQIADLEEHAEIARALLRTARMDAIGVVKRAVHQAQDEIASAASDARDTLRDEKESE